MAQASPTRPSAEGPVVDQDARARSSRCPGRRGSMTKMTSKARSAPITVSVRATASSPRSPGRVTAKNSRIRPAPSTSAASYREAGIFWMPATNSATHRPVAAQAPISPTATAAPRSKAPSQACAAESEADAAEALVERTVGREHPPPGDADDHGGDDLRQEDHRAQGGVAAHPAAVDTAAMTEAQADGDGGEHHHQDGGVAERRCARAIVRRQGAVVVQPDELAVGEAVPVEHRELGRLQERDAGEQQEEHERRGHVGVGHEGPAPPPPPGPRPLRGLRDRAGRAATVVRLTRRAYLFDDVKVCRAASIAFRAADTSVSPARISWSCG